jgi:hypothetical protein
MDLRGARILRRVISAVAIASICPAGVACSAGVASAHVSVTDAAATHAYLGALLALAPAQAAHVSARANAVDALAKTVKTECPDVLQHTTLGKDTELHPVGTQITLELSEVIPITGENVEHAMDEGFYKTVQRLRWSNPGLTKRLHDLALELAEESALPTPPLCADLKFWVASDYTATTAATKHFVQRCNEISSIRDESLRGSVRRLSSYEDNADRLLARKVLQKEPPPNSPAFARWDEAVDSVYEALGAIPGP